MFRKYWDIFGGVITGVTLAFIAGFKLETVQLCYSILILILVCIGCFRLIKQEHEKGQKRKHTIVDDIVDSQKPIKAISLSQSPTEEGEKLGKIIILLWGLTKRTMEKFKTFWSKFKGFMLTLALATLTAVEMCGGYINALCGGVLTIKGIAVLPLVTLVATMVVGIISNGYTKEQREKIKALFSKSSTDELVLAEIKKKFKENSAKLSQFNKLLVTQEHELTNFESELETLNNALSAKRAMYAMVPQLATTEDVQLANTEVQNCIARIAEKKEEIKKTQASIEALITTINALKSQL